MSNTMNITLMPNGTLDIDGDVSKVSTALADNLMGQVNSLLGDNLGAIRTRGIWVIGRRDADGGWTPLSGGDDQRACRSFAVALAEATRRTISSRRPPRSR